MLLLLSTSCHTSVTPNLLYFLSCMKLSYYLQTPHIMSLLVTSLRRVSGLRLPVLRSLSTVTRVPVIRDDVWSQVRPSLVSVSPLQNQIRCYSGPDPLNMKFIHDR